MSVRSPCLKITSSSTDDNIGSYVTSGAVVFKAFRALAPTDRAYSVEIRLTFLIAKSCVIVVRLAAILRRDSRSTPIGWFADNMCILPASCAVIVIALRTSAPANGTRAVKPGLALLITESCVIVFVCFTGCWRNPCATAIRALSIDMGIPATGTAVVVVPFRTFGTTLVRRQTALVIPGTF